MDRPPSPNRDLSSTRLLQRWYDGERAAVDELIRRHEPWIRERVRRRLGDRLRERLESSDIVQEALLRFCSDGPRIRVTRDAQLRALLTVIVENTIRDKNDFFRRHRRDLARDQPLSEMVEIDLDRRGGEAESPTGALEQAERHAVLRLAMEILSPEDREVVLLRTREGKTFVQIGEILGITSGAADTRFRRAARKLQTLIERIDGGGAGACIEEAAADTGE